MPQLRCTFLCGLFFACNLLPAMSFAQWEDSALDPIAETAVHEQNFTDCFVADPALNLHAVYERWSGFGLHDLIYAAKWNGGEWQEITTLADSGNGSFQPCVAFSTVQFIPFFAFVRNHALFVKFEGEVIWFESQVSPETQVASSPAITVDELGYIHLAWIFEDGPDNYRIGYAYGDGADWETGDLDYDLGPFGGGAAPQIVIDGQNQPNIFFRGGDYPDYRIQHAVRSGENFEINPVPTSNTADYIVDAATDAFGNIHAVISGNDGFGFPGRVQYLYHHPVFGWTFSITVSDPYSATNGAIVVDSYGYPHVVWAEVSGNFLTGNIYYSTQISTIGWESALLIGDDYMNPNFAITPDNYGHVLISSGPNTGNDNVYSLSSTAPLSESPWLDIEPDTVDFGQVAVGDTGIAAITITNSGTADLTISGSSVTANFGTNFETPIVLTPQESHSFSVFFIPASQATFGGWLSILSNAPQSPDSVLLTGIGFEEPSAIDAGGNIPLEFQLHQNYPNPFNPSTEIRFDLPVATDVRLTIFDMNGRRLTVVHNEHFPAGSHTTTWNAAGLPSGLYLIELSAGTYRDVRKALLLK